MRWWPLRWWPLRRRPRQRFGAAVTGLPSGPLAPPLHRPVAQLGFRDGSTADVGPEVARALEELARALVGGPAR